MLSDPPARLPSGRHRIPDQEVRDHQRGRLIDAICALSAERGYADTVINDIVARAGVSKSTFYRFYRSREDCLFDAHKRHCAMLIAAIDRARCEPEERPRSASGPGFVLHSSIYRPTRGPHTFWRSASSRVGRGVRIATRC